MMWMQMRIGDRWVDIGHLVPFRPFPRRERVAITGHHVEIVDAP